jgi:hypothetical protein
MLPSRCSRARGGEKADAVREGARAALVDCDAIFRAQEVNKAHEREGDSHLPARCAVIAWSRRCSDAGERTSQNMKLVLSVMDVPV